MASVAWLPKHTHIDASQACSLTRGGTCRSTASTAAQRLF